MEKKNKVKLSVIMPAYNEAGNLNRGVLNEVKDYLSKQEYSWEVIISDDGSTDGTGQISDKITKNWDNFIVQKNPHGGKPAALLYGLKAANGELVLFSDMDQSTPISELEKLLPFANEYDVVIGSRGVNRKNFPVYRKLGSFIFASIRKSFVLSHIDDTQCGFKLFNRNLVLKAFPLLEFFRKNEDVKGWKVTSYDVELLHILDKWGKKIKEVKVEWNDEDVSKSKGGGISRYLRESKEMLVEILRVKINDSRGLYELK